MSPTNSSRIIGSLTAIYAIGQMIGPTINRILTTFTQNYNAALIGATSVVLIGAMLLMGETRFDSRPNIEILAIK